MTTSMTSFTPEPCWRSIGVQGDRSCPELAHYVHCRNCPVYASGARHSLARAVEPGYAEAWADELARPAAQARVTDAAAMVFRVGAEWLALPLSLLSSVAPLSVVQRLPHRGGGLSSQALLGIVAAGGRLLPAVSLGRLLGIAPAAAAPDGRHAFARLLVLAEPAASTSGAPATAAGALHFALPVDEVHGVLRFAAAGLRPPAATVGRAPPPLVAGVLAGIVDGADAGLLDAGPLLTALKGTLR